MWLGHYLWDQSVVVEVLDVEDPPVEFEIIIGNLINVSDEILILKEEFEEFFIVAEFRVVLGNIRHLDVHA